MANASPSIQEIAVEWTVRPGPRSGLSIYIYIWIRMAAD
jgi:hypothetical protein